MKKLFLILSVCLISAIGCREGYLSEEIRSSAPKSGYISSDKSARAGEFEAETGKKFEEKIIRTASVSMRSSTVSESYDKTLSLVEKYQGLIVNSRISKYEDSEEATVEIKVLPKYFLSFLDDLKTIAEVESKNISEEDVTEEYYDITARLNNARKVQERLFDLLRKAHKVEDILRVEKEIERVGEKIETLEGKIRYLNSKTDYSRVTVYIYSRRIRVVETLGIKKGFIKSFQYAVRFFFGIIWFIIILIPLFIFLFILWLIILWIIKRKRRKHRK